MEPISQGVVPSPEKMAKPQIVEATGGVKELHASQPERTETKERVAPTSDSSAPIIPLPSLPAPASSLTPSTTSTASQVSGSPLVASDDDVIEREWVQRAKKIVAETRNDPYLQEREVSKLQADYIKKRYGKEIKVAGE